MKLSKTLFAAPLLAGLALAVFAPQPIEARQDGHEEGPVAKQMEVLGGNIRKLGKSIGSEEKRDETLATLATMQAAALEAKNHDPAKLASLPEKEQARLRASYRKDMGTFVKSLIDVEHLVLDGKYDDAQKAIRAQVLPLRNDGHDKYQD